MGNDIPSVQTGAASGYKGIQLVDITKAYGSNVVLDGFSCQIEDQAVTCIMGASGQGKTTLLRIMLGLETCDSGSILGMPNQRRSVVFQDDRLCENLSAASNIRLVCQNPIVISDITDAMNAVGLAPALANQIVRDMSGGERRRVVVLRALMAEYDILLMDEPFKGLDSDTKDMLMLYSKEQSKGKTVIFVTHDESECEIMGGTLIRLG